MKIILTVETSGDTPEAISKAITEAVVRAETQLGLNETPSGKIGFRRGPAMTFGEAEVLQSQEFSSDE